MKRFYIPFLLMAAAAVAACNNKAIVEDPAPSNGSYVFTLKASVPEATKTDYSSTGKFSWSAGDAISVLFHKGTENKFFTLSNTTGAGASADFSGTIDEGYEIGASDGTETDKKIWALFPASDNHVYTAGSYPQFFIPSEIDFTASGNHYSANLPMYAQVASEDALFAFNHLAPAYKFHFTDVSANKVKFVIETLKTFQLSDLIPISIEGSKLFLDHGYASPGSTKASLTMTANVVDESVSFYVPVRYWGDYQPVITLYDAETNETIYTNSAAASKTLTTIGGIKPISISVTGYVYQFPSKFNINWNNITVEGEGDSSSTYAGIKTVKAYADQSYLYVYFVVEKSRLNISTDNEYANQAVLYIGDESDSNCTKTSWIWGDSEGSTETYTKDAALGWLTYYGAPAFYSWESIVGSDTSDKAGKAEEKGDYFYYEARIPRSYSGAPMTSTSESTAHVGMILYYQKVHGVSGSGSYMIAPKTASHGGALLRVALPAYVAPE